MGSQRLIDANVWAKMISHWKPYIKTSNLLELLQKCPIVNEETSMEKTTYAKIMGLARTDDGFPEFGYVKLDGVQLQKDTVARLFNTTPDTVVMLTEDEYMKESGGNE